MAVAVMKRNDTYPQLRIQCLDQFGSPVNLTGGSALLVAEKPNGGTLSSAMVVEAGTDGYVNRDWVTGDVNEAGHWKLEVQATLASGKIVTFPAYGHLKMIVSEDLNG